MCKKHRSIFEDPVRYVTNDTQKTFKLRIVHCSEFVSEIFDLGWYLYPTSKNGEEWHEVNWSTRKKPLSEDILLKANMYGIPAMARDNIYDKEAYFFSL